MKILFVTKSLLNGGAETNICDLCEWFSEKGWLVEVVVFADSSERNLELLRIHGVRVVQLRERNYLRILAKLWRHLRTSDADVVHAHMPLANQACRVLRALARFHLVTTEHNMWKRIHFLHRWLGRALHKADSISLACSARVATSFPYPMAVNENGRNFRRFEASGGAPWPLADIMPSPVSVIYINVANVNKKKDHLYLLEAFRMVPEVVQGKKTYLLIVGARGDNWDEVARFIATNGMGDRVLLLGPRDDIAVLMQNSDAFVLSSRHEGLPLVVLEAMYLGLPVVSTSVGELPTLLEHTDWLVGERSASAFAEKMVAVVSSGLTAATVERNKELARECYSIDRQAGELEHIYRTVSHARAGKPIMRAEDRPSGPSTTMNSVVVVSKPYQALMALSTLALVDETAIFFVVKRGFSFAEPFFHLLEELDRGARIARAVFVDDYVDLRPHKSLIKGRKLYVEDDRVSLYIFFKGLEPGSLWLFEEGFGTYNGGYADLQPGLRNAARYLKWFCYSVVTGCGLYFGGGRETRAIYCTNPPLYREMNPRNRKEVIRIADMDAYREFFLSKISQQLAIPPGQPRAVIFLGPWGGGYDTLATLPREAGVWYFYKAHPHTPVRRREDILHFRELNIEIPAEYQIDYLSENFASVHVYHLSSTAALHSYRKGNVVFHDLARNQRFVALEEALRKCR